MNKVAKITLHGHLGEALGRKEWKLAVTSVGEAMKAIEILSGRRLFKYLLERDKVGAKYKVILNHNPIIFSEPPNLEKPETIFNTELCIQNPNIETIDIVPIIEGADGGGDIFDALMIVLGVTLIIVGAFLTPFAPGINVALVFAGLSLLATGVINLLSRPPDFEDFHALKGGLKPSYLFAGPEQTIHEGGPVPLGYGRLIVGSHVISASYEVAYVKNNEAEIQTT